MVTKRIGADSFVLDWGRKNRRIAFLHNREIKEGREIPVRDILKKKKQ